MAPQPGQRGVLLSAEIAAVVEDAVAGFDVAGRRVLVLVPDRTRSAPIAAMAPLVSSALRRHGAAAVTWLVALGTHRPLSQGELGALLGTTLEHGRTRAGDRALNHAWRDASDLVDCGELDAGLIEELSEGRLSRPVPVRANRAVTEHDLALVLGPVFPHEVIGFSGGNKYFFPGISGPEMIDSSHWLGALVTSRALIGRLGPTPVRRMIDHAAAMLPLERRSLSMVVAEGDAPRAAGGGSDGFDPPLAGLFPGTCEDAFEAASRLSAAVHVRRLPAPVERVVSVIPTRYEDLWTAAKGMYKLEPVVADGGEIVLYAPHVKAFSEVHGDVLARIGFHCRDYFVANWDRFSGEPLAVLAHSTHLRGQGTYDARTGEERPRITVRLATGIDRSSCEAAGLAYLDPAAVDLERLEADPGVLVVHDAGETLYRLEGD